MHMLIITQGGEIKFKEGRQMHSFHLLPPFPKETPTNHYKILNDIPADQIEPKTPEEARTLPKLSKTS